MPEIISPIDGQPAYSFELLDDAGVGKRLELASATGRAWRDSRIEERVEHLCQIAPDALAEDVEAGTVFTNRCDYLDPALAWKGVKDSGFDCSLSKLGFGSVTRPQSDPLRQQPH